MDLALPHYEQLLVETMTAKKKNRKNNKHVGFNVPEPEEKKEESPRIQQRIYRQPTTPGVLSKGQLTALILLALGISRLMQVGSTIHVHRTTEDGSPSPATEACIQHLGHGACENDYIQILLRFKFFSAVQVTMLVAGAMLQCWHKELVLLTLDAAMILSPLVPIAVALWASDALLEGRSQNTIMVIVLTVVAWPYDVHTIPFVSRSRRQSIKTLQSLVLMTLASMTLYRLIKYALIVCEGKSVIEELLETVGNKPTDASIAASHTILYFLMVDLATQTMVYIFAWYYFDEHSQRVSSIVGCNGLLSTLNSHALDWTDVALDRGHDQTDRVLLPAALSTNRSSGCGKHVLRRGHYGLSLRCGMDRSVDCLEATSLMTSLSYRRVADKNRLNNDAFN